MRSVIPLAVDRPPGHSVLIAYKLSRTVASHASSSKMDLATQHSEKIATASYRAVKFKTDLSYAIAAALQVIPSPL